ncbi:hypothetical protein N7493_001662 [Penicillium malachiteum]|uniref:Uncharacterized protein n=1 Tax=Penicillium malachiteum TaxID=1324776 RepID=A0AAD6HV70_9EURO|nr:hypothetical protein N7493_001662 [Penicillium malachiteum]
MAFLTLLQSNLWVPQRRLRVVMIGGGASGLNVAHHMNLHMENYELQIYEKNYDIGGTWFENSYFTSAEILTYFKGVATKYDLYKNIQLNHQVTAAAWDENQGIWNVEVKNLNTGSVIQDWGHVLINGCGVLNNWKRPEIPGLHSFAGDLIHSAAWPDSQDLTGKAVAVLGCGSSGVQIVPTIQPRSKRSLLSFGRRRGSQPGLPNALRVQEEKTSHALLPDFAVGCRRPTPGNGYLEALTKPNVHVVTDHISHVVPEGIVLVTGETVHINTFICPTGFDLSFAPRFSVVGRHGRDLAEEWKKKPRAYLSVAAPDFPNYFNKYATHSYLHRSLIQVCGIKAVSPLASAVDEFDTHINEFMKRTAWTTPCRSWFKNGTVDGPIVALHPGSRIHWFHMLADIRFEDWEFTYLTRNRFQYLGNGFSTMEEPGKDTTRYFDQPQDGYRSF